MDDWFKGVISGAVLVVVAGIVGASLSGSERAFDLSPFLALVPQGNTASPPEPEANPGAVGGQLQPPPLTRETFLALCPPGSVDETVPPVSLAQAQQLHQVFLAGQTLTDLIEVQAQLGQPTCNGVQDGKRVYLYWVETDKAITARQAGDRPPVELEFHNF